VPPKPRSPRPWSIWPMRKSGTAIQAPLGGITAPTKTLILVFVLKVVWLDDSIPTYGTPHSHFLLAEWAMGLLMGLSLRPITPIVLIDVPSQVAVSLITEENETQHTRVVFNPLPHIMRKRKSFCCIVIVLPKLVRMEDSCKWWFGNANFLSETARWFLGDSSRRSANS